MKELGTRKDIQNVELASLEPKERNKQIKKLFSKKYPGLKISIKKRNSGYLDAVDSIIYLKDSDIATLEQFRQRFNSFSSYVKFEFMGGGLDDNINWCNRDFDGYTQALYDYMLKFTYDMRSEIANDEANEGMEYLKSLFDSCNYDESDIMTDDFDRGIYDFYHFERI